MSKTSTNYYKNNHLPKSFPLKVYAIIPFVQIEFTKGFEIAMPLNLKSKTKKYLIYMLIA